MCRCDGFDGPNMVAKCARSVAEWWWASTLDRGRKVPSDSIGIGYHGDGREVEGNKE